MAIIMRRLLSEQRTNLGENAPLKQPYVLLIDPSNLCNLKCRFCPTGDKSLIADSKRKQTILDFNLYKSIIDQASEFEGNIKTLRLYKEGEPLINPYFAEMIDYGKKSRKFDKIDTTTNGLLLNRDLNKKIVEAGIDQINISVNGVSSEQIYYYTNTKIDYFEYVNNIKDLYNRRGNTQIYIKAIKDLLKEEEQEIFMETFGPISDKIYLERLSPAWPDFIFHGIEMNFDMGHYGQKIEERQVCPYLFYILVVNSDGTVSTCVGDWKHEQIIGDINKISLKDIWYGDNITNYWINHLQHRKNIYPMCQKCKVITHGSLDNIDMYSNEILIRIKEKDYL